MLGDDFDGHLWIHGANLEHAKPEFRAELRELLERTKDKVTFAGRYERHELPELMARTDWVVIPSIWWETGPLTVSEAFMHDRPVICSNIGGMSERVEDGVSGLHFRRGDHHDLAEVLSRAASERPLWDRLRAGIPDVHWMEEHATTLTRLYEQLLLERSAGADTHDGGAARRTEGRSRVPEAAAWLTRDVLLIVGDLGLPAGVTAATIEAAGGSEAVEARSLAATATDQPRDGGFGGLLLAHVPRPLRARLQDGGRLSIRAEGRSLSLTGAEIDDACRDVRELLRRTLAPLPAPARNRVTHFLATAAGSFESARGDDLSRALFSIRGALREHLRPERGSGRRGAGVDKLLRIDPTAFYLYGWMGDREADVTRITAVSPEGERVDLTERLFRFPRPDVWKLFGEPGRRSAGLGFVCYFELCAPSELAQGWLLETENERGDALEVEAPEVIGARDDVMAGVLEDPYHQRAQDDQLMSLHVVPAVRRLQEQVERRAEIESVHDFGDPPAAAEVSVIVPLYRRIDLIEYQLAKFADDPDLRSAELIYVLDSPEQRQDLLALAAAIDPIYRLPFRVCVLAENVGFAGACNAGAAIASRPAAAAAELRRASRRAGWLGELRAFYDGTPEIGALGAEAALRGRHDPGRRDVLLPAARVVGLARRPLLQGPAQELPRRQRPALGAWALGRLHDGQPRALRAARRPARQSTCAATTRTSTSACGWPRSAVRTGTCRRWSCTTSRRSPTRATCGATPTATTPGCTPTSGASGSSR